MDADIIDPALERLAAQLERLAKAEDALRSLACWLGVGGYNAETVDAKVFEQKIRDGVDALVRVETMRARGPQISDSEQTALLRRTIATLEAERDAAEQTAAQRAGADPEVRDVLLHEFGTTEPDLLRQVAADHRERVEELKRERDAATAEAASYRAVIDRLWADKDARQEDQEACGRLYKAWLDLRDVRATAGPGAVLLERVKQLEATLRAIRPEFAIHAALAEEEKP